MGSSICALTRSWYALLPEPVETDGSFFAPGRDESWLPVVIISSTAAQNHSSLKFLGRVSYSIYMSHIFVLWICNQTVRVVLHRPEAMVDGISTPQLSLLGAVFWYAIALAGTILLSTWVFRYVEEPCRLWSKQLAQRIAAPGGGPVRVAVAQNRD